MALVITFRSSVADTTSAMTYTCAPTYTPAANSLLVVGYVTSPEGIDPDSITGHGVSFTKLPITDEVIGVARRVGIWVANAGASPTSAAVVATFATNRTGCIIIEFEVTGADMSGGATGAIVQSPSLEAGSSTGWTATNLLAAASHADNRAIAFWANAANGVITEAGGNWAEPTGADIGHPSPTTRLEAQYTPSTFDRSPAASWSAAVDSMVAAVEIKAAVAAAFKAAWARNANSLLGAGATR
jgi:hypothetical protein